MMRVITRRRPLRMDRLAALAARSPHPATLSPTSPRGRGFSLIEVMLAVSLALGLMAAMLWFYRHTADIRNEAVERLDEIHTRRLVMDRITDQLRGALVYPRLSLGMEGQTDSITFVTAVLPGPSTWAVRQGTDDPIPPQQDLVLTTIGLRIVEDDSGVQSVEGLEAKTQRLLTLSTITEGVGIESALLSPQIKFARFRYWNGQEWADTWQDQKLPPAVEVAFGREYLPEGVEPIDYPYELSTRVIYLPGSQGVVDPTADLTNLLQSLGGGLSR